MEEKDNKPKNVTQIIDDVVTEICTHYCKYPGICNDEHMIDEICDKCPLNKLV